MARRSRMAVLKRQREIKKAEKAAKKRAKRHGGGEGPFSEPRPTVSNAQLLGRGENDEGSDASDTEPAEGAAPGKTE